jgi:hypothetical protein
VDNQVSGDGTRGWQFERFVMDLLKRMPDVRLLVQVKLQTPQTLQRSRDIIDQLKAAEDRYQKFHPDALEPDLLAVFPGVPSPPKAAFFNNKRVDFWDGRYLCRQARLFSVSVPDLSQFRGRGAS